MVDVKLWYIDLDNTVQFIETTDQYVTWYETGIVFVTPDGSGGYNYIFQPYARIARIITTTSVGWR